MTWLPIGELAPHTPRVFVPVDLEPGDPARVLPLFDQLEQRLAAVKTTEELETWIIQAGELRAAIDEERARRYIAMTCHTEDPVAEKAYLDLVEHLDPALKPRLFRLSQLFLQHPLRSKLPMPRYAVFDRNTALKVELYRDENVPLETEDERLQQQYQKLIGAQTVQYRGEERTLVQMGRFQEDPDRAVREAAWRLVAERRQLDAQTCEQLFDEMIELRQRQAKNAGFANYRDFAFKLRGRFDYGPADCVAFHQAIEREVVPLLRRLQERRRTRLGVESLRPWDLAVDPLNRPPLRPFADAAELETKSQRIFDRLSPELSADFRLLREKRLLDLANRKGKAPGGYQYTLSEARMPFIFMNAVGLQRDVETLLHEAGHAFHALATREEPLEAYRDAPIEFCEVASMSMELLAAEHLDEFYSADEVRRARTVHLEGVVDVFPWIATIDAFQHWIYTHPGHTRAERQAAWMELRGRFGGGVDWSGLENYHAILWHKQSHLFLNPFYYVEYGIAQIGALQVWANARVDRREALAAYRRGLALGGSRPLPELFAAAGCRLDFSAAALKPLVRLLETELFSPETV